MAPPPSLSRLPSPLLFAPLLVTLAALAGCDAGMPERDDLEPPPVHLIEVQLATDVVDGALVYSSFTEGQAAKGVVSTTAIKLRFDRFLLPTTAVRQAICVQPVIRSIQSLRECELGVFLEPSYDPARREITFRPPSDATRPAFQPGTAYRLTIFPPDYDKLTPGGVEAFDGAWLDHVAQFDFTTRAADPEGAKLDRLPSEDRWCAAVKPRLAGCSYGLGCHGPWVDEGGAPQEAAMGLDLRGGVRGTAIGHVAHQTMTGEHADLPERSGLRFGRAMPLVDPGSPGNSYLLYKALVSPLNLDDPGLAKGEIERLRESVVVGLPMPPSHADGAALGSEGLEEISTWILQGAPTPDCSE